MAKTNVSEWDIVADNNIRINGINIDENCPPSAINNAIREMMSQIKKWKDGYTDPLTGLDIYQSLTVQNIDVKGIIKLNGSAGTDGQVLLSKGASASPVWGDAFVRGMIMLWSGSTSSVPSGWVLCNGSNDTPDLRDRFVVGAGSTYAVDAKGGSKDAVAVSHNHTGTTSTTGNHSHTLPHYLVQAVAGNGDIDRDNEYQQWKALSGQSTRTSGNHAHTFTTSTSGSSGTNKNLPPYYALAYIMKL